MTNDTPLPFFSRDDFEVETVEGDVQRFVYTGANMQVIEYRFPPHKHFPAHRHAANEQMGYLVSGRMGFRVGDKERILNPGDWYHAPAGVEHCAWTLDEPSVLLDFFAPPRSDLVMRVKTGADR